NGKEIVQRPTLVGLEVRESDVAQSLERNDLGDRLRDQRKHPLRPCVKDERFIVGDQVLVEVEADATGKRDRGVDAIDAPGDLVEGGAARSVGNHGFSPGWDNGWQQKGWDNDEVV